MPDLAQLAQISNVIGAPAMLALLYVVWRFDRRLYRLEILFIRKEGDE